MNYTEEGGFTTKMNTLIENSYTTLSSIKNSIIASLLLHRDLEFYYFNKKGSMRTLKNLNNKYVYFALNENFKIYMYDELLNPVDKVIPNIMETDKVYKVELKEFIDWIALIVIRKEISPYKLSVQQIIGDEEVVIKNIFNVIKSCGLIHNKHGKKNIEIRFDI